MLAENEINKVKEIINDCMKYIERYKKMPPSFNLTEREFAIVRKARQEGMRLTVEYQNEKTPIPITRSFNS